MSALVGRSPDAPHTWLITQVLGVARRREDGMTVPVVVYLPASASTMPRTVLCGRAAVPQAVENASLAWHVRDPAGWHDGHRLAMVQSRCPVCAAVEANPVLRAQRSMADLLAGLRQAMQELARGLQDGLQEAIGNSDLQS